MNEIKLKYGLNPHQKEACISMPEGGELPFRVLSGKPGYINFLDAVTGWALVSELKNTLHLPAAASMKHVSPAGAAAAMKLSDTEKKMFQVDGGIDLSPISSAYIRARGTDRVSSYGDFAALSDICDASCAAYLKSEVSDGIVAPGYTDEALSILKTKKKGNYLIIEADPRYLPPGRETREIFGIGFSEERNDERIDESLLRNIVSRNKCLTDEAKKDLLLGLVTLKYTQSNSVAITKNLMTMGVAAGQQSRIGCTRIAAEKAGKLYLRSHEKVLGLSFADGLKKPEKDNLIDRYISGGLSDILENGEWRKFFKEKPEPMTREEAESFLETMSGTSLCSDAFFPFGDSLEVSSRAGVSFVAEPGGSLRDADVTETADRFGMVLCFTGLRLFTH